MDTAELTRAAEQPVARRKRRRSVLLVQIAALAAAVYWLVVPRLGDTERVLYRLDDVSPTMVVLGTALGVAALLAYAQVTRNLLPRTGRPKLARQFGVVVSSVGVNRVAPLGMAAGAAVAYKLLVREGLGRGDIAFAMGVQAVGSALVLQVILWPAMLIAAPLSGISPALRSGLYLAGGFGLAFLAIVAFVLWGLYGRRDATTRILVAVANKLRIGRDRAGEGIASVCTRLDQLRSDPRTVVRTTGWAMANWLTDAASLWVFLLAFGADVSPLWVLVAFGVANVVAMVPITPGSLGITETTLAIVLIGFGAATSPVFLGIAAYRMVHYWLPIPGGLLAYTLLRVRPAVAAPPAN
jgi:putative heme transporter